MPCVEYFSWLSETRTDSIVGFIENCASSGSLLLHCNANNRASARGPPGSHFRAEPGPAIAYSRQSLETITHNICRIQLSQLGANPAPETFDTDTTQPNRKQRHLSCWKPLSAQNTDTTRHAGGKRQWRRVAVVHLRTPRQRTSCRFGPAGEQPVRARTLPPGLHRSRRCCRPRLGILQPRAGVTANQHAQRRRLEMVRQPALCTDGRRPGYTTTNCSLLGSVGRHAGGERNLASSADRLRAAQLYADFLAMARRQ